MADGFYVRWVLANGWSEALGLGTTILLGASFAPTLQQIHGVPAVLLTAVVAVALGVLLEGLVVGAAQGFVLRRRLSGLPPRVWIRLTMIGAGLAWLLGMVPSSLAALSPASSASQAPAPPGYLQYALAAGLGAVAGPVLGLAQWTALRGRVRKAGRWLWANAAAWAVGMPVIFLGMDRVPWGGPPVARAAAVFAVCGLAGLTVGAIHGGVLLTIVPPPTGRRAGPLDKP